MSVARLIKALLVPALAVPALAAASLAAPLLGAAAPAAAATAACEPDPYNGVCVTPQTYAPASGAKLAVQKTPKTGNISRYLAAGAPVAVICQISGGGTADGKTATTWAAVSGGGWVYDASLTTPRTGSDGYSPGIRHCGAAATPLPTFNPTNYPWPTQDGWVLDGHGSYQGECVSFAAWAVRTDGRAHTKSTDFLGNANLWTGAYVDTTPQVGDIAQWDAGRNGAGSAGHVAYVTAVNTNGTITITEYNWGNFHRLNPHDCRQQPQPLPALLANHGCLGFDF
jgi:surface antigen